MAVLPSIIAGANAVQGVGQALSALGIGGGEKRPRYRDALLAQKYATQNDFDIRMEMAQKHKIHPLVALGVPPTQSVQPMMQIGSHGPDLERMGQGISRAASALQEPTQRAMEQKSAELQLENQGLQNERLRSEIALMRTSRPPSFAGHNQAIAGQGDTLLELPTEVPYGSKGGPHGTAGAIPDIGYSRSSPTRLDVVPSEPMKQRMEDDFFQQLKWHGKHSVPIVKNMHYFRSPPPYPVEIPPPSGYKKWVWTGTYWKASKKGGN